MEKSTFRVLIVDDYEPWRRFMLSNLLKWPQLQVVGEACDGREAVLKSQQLQPDLILLDIGLPKMNGIETARQIRRQSPNVRILFCTENHSPDIAEAALRTGAKGYVVKSDAARDLFPAMTAVFAGGRFLSPRFAELEFARTSDTPSVSEKGHVVHFYTDDIVLLDRIATLFGGSLADGKSVAAIMTASHRSGLERRLLAQGVDVSEATESERLCILDAGQVLSELMEPTGPNRERFLLQFGNILRRLQAATIEKRGGVVVFGEMVAVLWAQKNYDAAIRLEELWNELALTCSFYLCCAYPANAFRDELTVGPYAEICAQHSEVVSALEAIAVPHE